MLRDKTIKSKYEGLSNTNTLKCLESLSDISNSSINNCESINNEPDNINIVDKNSINSPVSINCNSSDINDAINDDCLVKDFEPFYEELDGKEYYFTKDEEGLGVYFKKLKKGKISKKVTGKWSESGDGELILE